MKKLCYFIILINLFIFEVNGQLQQIYVSPNGNPSNNGSLQKPLASIQSAIDKARSIKKNKASSAIEVILLEGNYRLNAPVKIDPDLNNLKISGIGLEKVVVKGSQKLELDWKKFNQNIWIATIENTTTIDQLFIDEKQQVLARYPNYNENGGHWQGHAKDAISKERVQTWKNPKGGFVHAMHSGEWGGFHYEIIEAKKDGTLELKGGRQNNRPSKMHETYRMVENIFEELDAPNEWYFNQKTKKLYYWPTENIDLKSAVVEVVMLKNLISIQGSKEKPVENIEISGIKFEHAQRTFIETTEPLLRSDWTIYRGGAVFIEYSKNVSINDCEFTNLGGNVIFVSNYNRNVQITGNHIHDNGASGVSFVGNPSAVRSPSFQYSEFVPLQEMDTIRGPKNDNFPKNCVIDNNLIYRIGRVEKQVSGVQISMAMNITISNNSIYDTPRAGINVSEGTWGGHIIEQNDVFNTVLETSDHGAFNSWGRDRFWHPNRKTLDKITSDNPEMPYWDAVETTIIRNNRFRCDHGWDIDLDDGSSNYKIYNNVCLKGGIKLREGFYRTVENNIMVNNSFHPHVWFKNSGDVFKHNIVMTDYKDIRLDGWGKEVDSNLFPDEKALVKAQKNNTDVNSLFGNPLFKDAEKGDYSVLKNSKALEIGFKNFAMNQFGVKKASLKAISKSPELPKIWSITDKNIQKDITINLLGGTFKNITTLEERSAAGLSKTAGVVLITVDDNSVISKSTLINGDVIIFGEDQEINSIPDLMNVYEGHNWKGQLKLVIFRNQKEQKLTIKTK